MLFQKRDDKCLYIASYKHVNSSNAPSEFSMLFSELHRTFGSQMRPLVHTMTLSTCENAFTPSCGVLLGCIVSINELVAFCLVGLSFSVSERMLC